MKDKLTHLRDLQQHQRRGDCASTAAIRNAIRRWSAWWKIPNNIVGIEVTRQFNGLYHVLGGALSPLRGIGPEQLRIKSLMDRIAKRRSRGDDRRDESDR